MDDSYYLSSTNKYLVETFTLNSYHRIVSRKGKGRKPDPAYRRKARRNLQTLSRVATGQKCNDFDLQLLTEHFEKYIEDVNLILQKVYTNSERLETISKKLKATKSSGYVVLRNESILKWSKTNEFGKLVYERMHRNALETAARLILANHSRRDLIQTLVQILNESEEDLHRLMKNKRVPVDLVRRVRNNSETKNNGSGFHYALSACKQVRRILDELVLSKKQQEESETTEQNQSKVFGGRRAKQRIKVQECWNSNKAQKYKLLVKSEVSKWYINGFSFTIPVFRKSTQEFAASTENSTGQGYWFDIDTERQDEVVFYIKTPPGILNRDKCSRSPYRNQTIRFRFLNWFPRKAKRAQEKAKEARRAGDLGRAQQLEFRAAVFLDMDEQLKNTIALHQAVRKLVTLKSRKENYLERITSLKESISVLQESRRSAPPTLLQRGKKVILSIPFLRPSKEILEKKLSNSRISNAGVDRGIRHPVVITVRDEHDTFHDRFIGYSELISRRAKLRQRTRELKSQIDRRRNNWEKKHPGLQAPSHIHKKERELAAIWRKVRRLDREISHQVACATVWFCEQHHVKTVYFEDLRYYQGKGGMHSLSWKLSTNLWGIIIQGTRYRRESMGHKRGGVWTVNPAWTSQTCNLCGERGVRVEKENDIKETKGGEYFYCPNCHVHLHADVNAARNIVKIKTMSSAIPGRIT
jgi:hypothetical protein